MGSAVFHLNRMPMSIFQIRKKLEAKTDNQDWIEEVIERCINIHYLKRDPDFAYDYCQRQFMSEKGSNYIRIQLKAKGIPDDIIETALSEVVIEHKFDEEKILKDKVSRIDSFEGKSKEELYNELVRDGFDWKMVDKAIRAHKCFNILKSKAQIKGESADLEKSLLKLFRKGKGLRLIKSELKSKYIDIEGIDVIINKLEINGDIDFYNSALISLMKKRYNLEDYKEKSKAYAFLSGRGFSSDEIKYAIDEILGNNND